MNQTLGTNSSRKNQIQYCIAVLMFFVSFCFLSVNNVAAQYQTTVKAVTKDINPLIKGYQESLPVDYSSNPSKKYPLLIFIHGKAECGDGSAAQLPRVLNVGLGYNLRAGRFPSSFTANGEKFSFIVAAPQLRSADYLNASQYISDFIAYCKRTYRVDESMIYVTGLSMGGVMLWSFGGTRASEVTGIVPICGGGSPNNAKVATMAKNNLAVWATHNSNDPTLPSSSTKNWIAALTAYVPKMTPQPLMTIFESANHDAWSKTYDVNFRVNGKNIYEWMLSYRKGNVTTPTNQAPVANAGSAQTITLPTNSVTLNGSQSTAGTGSITSYAWTKSSGGTATITSASASKTTVTALVAGTYTFALTVTNTAGLKSTSTVTITVKAAQPPVAQPGAAQTITLPTNSVTLDGSTSTTPAGSITAYTWAKTSGGAATITSASSAKTTVTGLVAGTYSFTLTVTNSAGLKASSAVTITVTTAEAPTANAGSAKTITLPTNSVTLDGSKSTTPDGSITKYAWVKTSGSTAKITNASVAKTTVTGLVAGTYNFTLTVTNSGGLTSSDNVVITVKPVPASTEDKTSPLADAGADKSITLPTSTVTLDGGASKAQVGRIISYAWSKVAGGAAQIENTSAAKTAVSGLEKGSYTFSLLVTSDNGKRAAAEVKVVVNEAPASGVEDKTAPVSDAGSDKAITLPTSSVSLDGTGSVAQVGRIISYTWSKLSGGAAIIASAGSAKTSVTGLVKGTYTFSLLVISDNGKRSTDEVKVVVNESATANKSANANEVNPLTPVANAGANKTVTLPTNNVTLDGTGSTVTVGRIISYAWTKVSGGAASIVSAGSAKTSVTGLAAGSYVFSLLVISDNGQRNTSTVNVTVANGSASARVASVSGAQQSGLDVLELSSDNKLELSAAPNPATSDVTLVVSSAVTGKTSILIYNLQGHLVQQEEFNKDNTTKLYRKINVSKLNPGIYLINVNVGSQAKQTIRLVKQ